MALIGGGSALTIAAMRLVRELASNARFPVAISYSTAPNAKMSVRASASNPSSCSGAMYWNVPKIVPSCVSGFCCVARLVAAVMPSVTELVPLLASSLARPKSSNFTPDFVSMMFPGLRSRWTMPCLCARSRAFAISPPMRVTWSGGRAPR